MSKIVFAQRYTCISRVEIDKMTPDEFDLYLELLDELIKRENTV